MKQQVFEEVIDISEVSSVKQLVDLCQLKHITYEDMVVEVVGHYDYHNAKLAFGFYRQETKDEYMKRTDPEKYEEMLEERKEFQQYLELKKKFEHRTKISWQD